MRPVKFVAARVMDASDEKIIDLVMPFVKTIIPEIIDGIDMTHVARFPQALTLHEVGCFEAVHQFKRSLVADAPIQFTGDYMMVAIGQGVAAQSGTITATNIIENFR